MPLKADGKLRSQAQSTVDYFYRVAREHPDGERPENPISPDATYETQSPPQDDLARRDAELRETEHARNVAEFRDQRPLTANQNSPAPKSSEEQRDSPKSAETSDSQKSMTHFAPEVVEFDRQAPLIAEPGVDRRRARPEWRFSDRSGSSGQAPRNVSATESGSPIPGTNKPSSQERQKPKNNSVRTTLADIASEIPAPPGELRSTTQVETASPEVSYGNSFFDVSEQEHNNQSSLHGPSFLGLDSDSDVEYLDEDDGDSHIRRNLALAVLVVVLVLAAVQWRSIRDFGLRYAGTMHLPARFVGAAKRADNQSAASTAVPPGATTTPAANGQPEIITEPVKNPNAAQNSSTEEPKNPANPNPASPNSANGADSNTSGTPPAAEGKSSDNALLSKADNSRLPQGEPAEDNTDKAETADKADAKAEGDDSSTKSNAHARKSEPTETARPEPGQIELAQASAALDPATQVSWLWKAVGKGSADAQVRLADLYLDGRGVPQNCEQALVLLNSASRKNYSRARIRLGSLYATGKCVPQDRVAAYHWMTLALDSSPGSQWVEENRQMLWSHMSAEERRRAGGRM